MSFCLYTQVRMSRFIDVVVFICCVVCANTLCSNVTICVTNGNDARSGCIGLSQLTVEQISCRMVHIYLTSGTHILDKNLTIADRVEQTAIYGAQSGQPSTVQCERNGMIRFSENKAINEVFLSNIHFVHCGSKRLVNDSPLQVALYFKNAAYTLKNVEVKCAEGYGLCADHCTKQVIDKCKFSNNTQHMRFIIPSSTPGNIFVIMNDTSISDGKNGTGVSILISKNNTNFSIANCAFLRNRDGHLELTAEHRNTTIIIIIKNSSFIGGNNFGVDISAPEWSDLRVIVHNSHFSSSEFVGLAIYRMAYVDITGCTIANNVAGMWIEYANISAECRIANCTVKNNTDTGILVFFSQHSSRIFHWWTEISLVMFYNNTRALSLSFPSSDINHETKISECSFTNHRIPPGRNAHRKILNIEVTSHKRHASPVIIEKSSFRENIGYHGKCSVIYAESMNLKLKDVNITDNNCTAIMISKSKMEFIDAVLLARNQGLEGGALHLNNSQLTFTRLSELKIINNTSHTYGGGIYSEQECQSIIFDCFFQLGAGYGPTILSKMMVFLGNNARSGGDIVFGGCLSSCRLWLNQTQVAIDKSNGSNEFWKIVSSENAVSPSTFLELPKRAAFCTTAGLSHVPSYTCTDSYTVSVYRGQMFTVPLVVADEFCVPSIDLVEANVIHPTETEVPPLTLEHGVVQKSKKYCVNFSYTLSGGLNQNRATIEFHIQRQVFSRIPSVVLTVNLKDCPPGYELNSKSGQCVCLGILELYKIQCPLDNTYSLKIPAQTWVGKSKDGFLAVVKYCIHCKKRETLLLNVTESSDDLCVAGRHGVLCGACVSNYSLKLGGYECADCSNSTYKGVLLLIGFVAIGIALVLLLLCLNLTVSTGTINGLIFFSNIVYLNSDTLLPIIREGNSTHLQNTVRILSTFQAWMNLDFGIDMCFFDGYDTYMSTWMEFAFPLYVWLLVLGIVLASRYSRRISKLTTSNTVPVLATLLLLSYAKLLKTSIDAASFRYVQSISDSSRYRVWFHDGSIPHLQGKHIPLSLMSLFIVLVYMPFTLLILLGPLLQAKSHYRVLQWINKLKPFLDAFYGPYTSRYRFWPGILLLARVTILVIFSVSNNPFELTACSVIVSALLVCWILVGRTVNVSLHQKKLLNCVELFFLVNLQVFTTASIYNSRPTNITHQQGLAVVMVGSALAASCGILVYQTCYVLGRFEVTRPILRRILRGMGGKDRTSQPSASPAKPAAVSTNATYSVVEMTQGGMPTNELREPLLTSL